MYNGAWSAAIFDLDNCLFDDAWRIPYIDFSKEDLDERYAPYHERCYGDHPTNLALFNAIKQLVPRVIFATARPEAVRRLTERSIADRLGHRGAEIIMRPNGDNRPSRQLKRDMFRRTGLFAHTTMAFDDHHDVIAMYREIGLRAARVWIHDVCPYTPPVHIHPESVKP
jgi:hypothetical protein